MKLIKMIVVCCALSGVVSLKAWAALGTVYGQVQSLRISDHDVLQRLVITTNDPSGTCFDPPGSTAYFRIPDDANGDKMRAVLLAAQLAGRNVQIFWDDFFKDGNNYCYVRQVTLVNS